MKIIKQKSTGKIVYREDPHSDKTITNAVIDTKIELSDLEVVEENWSESDWETNTVSYSDRRKAEYPPATDYLDGIVKGDQAQVDKYIADCLAVKDKYPK